MVLGFAYELFQTMQSGGISDDDSSDRLSYRVTTTILIVSSILIGTKQLVGDPISCWIPAHFTGNHEKYTDSYCWVRNTYYLPWDENIPKEHEHDKRYMITYYQWIPLILMLQALFFYLPRMIWVGLNTRVGLDVNRLMESAKSLQNCLDFDKHQDTLKNMAKHAHRMLKRPHGKSQMTLSIKSCISRAFCKAMGRSKGNYLIMVFVITKIFFLANILGQMFVLNHVLGFNFNMYGIEVLKRIAHGQEWIETPFPRVTMCDMKIRRLGNVHRYAVQCVLPINLFTEKLYLFQWFWYVLLCSLAILELIQWAFRILFLFNARKNYITKQLTLAKANFDEDDQMVLDKINDFVNDYLKQDGVFLLRLIAKNTTQGVACMFTHALYKEYEEWLKEKQQEKEKELEDADPLPKKKPLDFDDSTMPLRARQV